MKFSSALIFLCGFNILISVTGARASEAALQPLLDPVEIVASDCDRRTCEFRLEFKNIGDEKATEVDLRCGYIYPAFDGAETTLYGSTVSPGNSIIVKCILYRNSAKIPNGQIGYVSIYYVKNSKGDFETGSIPVVYK